MKRVFRKTISLLLTVSVLLGCMAINVRGDVVLDDFTPAYFFNGHYYMMLLNATKNKDQAYALASEMGGSIMFIDSKEEQEAIERLIINYSNYCECYFLNAFARTLLNDGWHDGHFVGSGIYDQQYYIGTDWTTDNYITEDSYTNFIDEIDYNMFITIKANPGTDFGKWDGRGFWEPVYGGVIIEYDSVDKLPLGVTIINGIDRYNNCVGVSLNYLGNHDYFYSDSMDYFGNRYFDVTVFYSLNKQASYFLNSQYKTFSGVYFVPGYGTGQPNSWIKIYADGVEIKGVESIKKDDGPVSFVLNVEGVTRLDIETGNNGDYGNPYLVFANTVLTAKDCSDWSATDIYQKYTQVTRYNDHFYKAFNVNCDYNYAKRFCEQIGGHLVSFDDNIEHDYVYNWLKNTTDFPIIIEDEQDAIFSYTYDYYISYYENDSNDFVMTDYQKIDLYTGECTTSSDSMKIYGFVCEWDSCDDYAIPLNHDAFYHDEENGEIHGYQIFYSNYSYSEAKKYCETIGGKLAEFGSMDEGLNLCYDIWSDEVQLYLLSFANKDFYIASFSNNTLIQAGSDSSPLIFDCTSGVIDVYNDFNRVPLGFICEWDEVENQVVILGDFELSKDTWSFANHKLSFLDYPDGDVSKNTIARLKYYIPEERYRQVYGDRYVQMAHAAKTDDSKDTSYESMIPSTWNGSCSGMAASVLLFNTGRLSYDGDLISYYDEIRYESDIFGTSIYATSGYDTPMTRLIESLQISRFYDNYVTSDDYCSEEKIDDVSANIIHESDGDFVDKFYNYVKNSNSPVLVAIYFSEYETISDFDGHALLVYGYETKADDDGWIKLYVYDCNYPYPSDDLLGVGYDCANFYTTNPRYMEINVDKNLWRYNGSINASTPSRYVGCDANGDLITHTLKVNKVVKYNFPDFFLYFDCSVIPSSFDGTRISRFYSDEGYSHLMLSANTNLNIYSNNDELLACCENGYGLSLSDEVEFIPYISEGNNEDDYVKGYFSINSNSYRIEYVDGDDITIVDSDGVINLEFSGEASIEVNTIDNCVEVLSESDNDMSVQIANDDGEELTALYIEGIMVEGDILECSVNELGEMDANLTTENDSTELDVYLYNENSEESEYVETLCLTKAESNHDVDAFLNGEEVVEEPTPSVTTTPSISPTVVPTTSPATTPGGETGSGATPTSAPITTAAPTTTPTGGSTGGNSTTPSANPTSAPTAVPTAAPTAAPELSVGDFINRCYSVALGREADEAGYNYWVDNLNNGQACGAQVGYGFIFSQEYINKDRTDEEFVNDMYAMYFGREADNAGFNYWVDALKSGLTREDIMAGFANSEEFYNLCIKYGVVCGTYLVGVPNDVQGGVNCFVARMYKVCLNRLPDMGGQAGWVLKLMNGDVTGTSCAYGFVFSPEFIGKEPSNKDFVNYMYAAFFGREADEAGFNAWVDVLNGGGSYEDVFAGFSGSAEFANLCAGYGIQA